MFGIGKLAGGLCKAVGLGKLAPFVSAAANFCTGNYAGFAMDVAGIANKLTGGKLGFLNKIAQFAPIASTFMGGGASGIGNLFKSGGLSNLMSSFKNLDSIKGLTSSFSSARQGFQAIKSGRDVFGGATKIYKAFEAANEFGHIRNSFQLRSANQHRQFLLGNVNRF